MANVVLPPSFIFNNLQNLPRPLLFSHTPKGLVQSIRGEQSHLLQWTARWSDGVERKEALSSESQWFTHLQICPVHLSAGQEDALKHSHRVIAAPAHVLGSTGTIFFLFHYIDFLLNCTKFLGAQKTRGTSCRFATFLYVVPNPVKIRHDNRSEWSLSRLPTCRSPQSLQQDSRNLFEHTRLDFCARFQGHGEANRAPVKALGWVSSPNPSPPLQRDAWCRSDLLPSSDPLFPPWYKTISFKKTLRIYFMITSLFLSFAVANIERIAIF